MPGWIQSLDGAVLLWIQEVLRIGVLNPLMVLYTRLGDAGLLWIGLSLLLLCFRQTRRAGALALCAMALGLVCNNLILKHLVQRPRPYLMVDGLHPLVPPPDPNSFPSGHTCAALAAALSWRYALPRRWMRVSGLVLAALMGFSRLYVGVHFPTDVLVGGAVGALCAWAVWLAWRAWTRRRGTPEAL